MNAIKIVSGLCFVCGLAGSSAWAGGYGNMSGGAMGNMIRTTKGMSLYVFDKDTNGHSNCYADCAKEWPPLLAGANATPAGSFSLIKRDDGTLQWAFSGKPLYLFDEDKAPGDVKGDGYSPDWHLATSK